MSLKIFRRRAPGAKDTKAPESGTRKVKDPKFPIPGRGALSIRCSTNYNLADNSFPALNLATFFALILITAPV
jgi:hypothetical protein